MVLPSHLDLLLSWLKVLHKYFLIREEFGTLERGGTTFLRLAKKISLANSRKFPSILTNMFSNFFKHFQNSLFFQSYSIFNRGTKSKIISSVVGLVPSISFLRRYKIGKYRIHSLEASLIA